MNSDYIMLGLREDATLEDAKVAYEYWKKKYKAADFDDEPEYAKRKIRALGEAYSNVCMNIAGYVPESAPVSEPGPAKKIRRLTKEAGSGKVSMATFTEGLKNAAKSLLDEIDRENGYAPSFSDGLRLDTDYDEIDD